MNEVKKTEKKFDKFNYESIDENTIKNENIEEKTFTLIESETEQYQKFLKRHKKCQLDKNGKNKFAPNEGGISVTLTLTSLGNMVECKCHGCKTSKNITDYDSW
mgnify:CR=1 FL=1